MSRMLPSVCSEDVKSYAERRIFDLLRTDPDTSGWTCLHSLGLARHCRQVYGEIDFVVMIPNEGIFCLEVKGGNVARTDGLWTFTNRYGERNTRSKSPYAQVMDNMFSLSEGVQVAFGRDHRLSRLLYGWAVLFPDVVWDRQDVEAARWQIYDRDFRGPISAFLLNVSRETQRSVPHRIAPTQDDIEELTNYLRGDFELVETPARRLQHSDYQMRRLTEEQFRCLDGMERNPRCLFEGGAGTGKTFLAIELARRNARTGKRVLLVCFNRLLGSWLSAALPASKNPGVVTTHFHALMETMIATSTVRHEYEGLRQAADTPAAKRAFFQETMPFYASIAASEGNLEPYDTIVVDEGQDLIKQEYLDVLDIILRGGLAGGRWAMFCDLHRQAIYQDTSVRRDGPSGTNVSADRLLSLVADRAPHFASFRLTINCRNTRPIGEETAMLSGFDAPPYLASELDGASVDYRFYSDTNDQRRKLIDILSELQREGLTLDAIHIIAPVSRHQSVVADGQGFPFPIFDLDERSIIAPLAGVGFATVQAYKGLENVVIILTDVRKLDTPKDQSLLYVGMSRARQRLYVLLTQESRAAYNEAVRRTFLKGRHHP